jgi:DNA-binding NarL/FixJ family response regulator
MHQQEPPAASAHQATGAATNAEQNIVRILLVDDHAIIRAGLRMLIEKRPDFQVVGEADNRADALRLVQEQHPDVTLLDVDLGQENGIDFLSEILQVGQSDAKVLLLTGLNDRDAHSRAVRSGALGVVLKERAPEVLLQAIQKVHQGEVWLERTMVATALTGMWRDSPQQEVDPEASKIAELTEREYEVIMLVAQGLKNQQIADRLFVSEPTVRRHLSSIFTKLDVADRLDLVVYAFQHGLATPNR